MDGLSSLNSTIRDPVVDVILVEADVLADLVERDATLADEAADEAFRCAEAFGELDGGLPPEWISLFANSPDGRRYFQSKAKQTTNLASINMTELRSTPVPVPPSQEQLRIVECVTSLVGLCEAPAGSIRASERAERSFADAFESSA